MLERFLNAQEGSVWGSNEAGYTYEEALQEVKNGRKRGHWIWYIFPQMRGLGKSERSVYYGINGREEAKAYAEHPVLGKHLVEICEVLYSSGHSVYDIFGADVIKVRSCVQLFATISGNPIFSQLKARYCW